MLGRLFDLAVDTAVGTTKLAVGTAVVATTAAAVVGCAVVAPAETLLLASEISNARDDRRR
ncbi:MAG TPA: hypothetical protein VK694_00950 [Verrucomicrobiae bacterium]|nr:hypothetical protein [Verrucomicrobiae bacterium]